MLINFSVWLNIFILW